MYFKKYIRSAYTNIVKKFILFLKGFEELALFPNNVDDFLLAPFKRFSYFLTSDIPSFTSFVFFTSSFRFAFSLSETSRIDACNSFLIISAFFFLFVFLMPPRYYKWKKILLKPFCRFTKRCKSTRFGP